MPDDDLFMQKSAPINTGDHQLDVTAQTAQAFLGVDDAEAASMLLGFLIGLSVRRNVKAVELVGPLTKLLTECEVSEDGNEAYTIDDLSMIVMDVIANSIARHAIQALIIRDKHSNN